MTIPEKIGQYTILRKLGSGGMGTVYLGQHLETSQLAAIKVLPASLAREEGFVVRFTREIEAMQALNNPHVVQVYESGVDDETYYYVMEYVEGETLSQHLRGKGRIPWQKTIDYAVQICLALKSAHDAGIIHRDLKPSNLLITNQDQIKLLDFGVAQVFASSKLTKTGGIIGTAEYMSPEQAQGRRSTKKSDLYSLGAVMYAMLTARPPFSGKTSMEVIQKHKFGQFDPPRSYVPEIPHWLNDVVCQCLDKDPEKRFPDAYVLSLRLKEILKKVELSQLNVTSATGTFDGTAQTIVAGPHPPDVGGTLMRDLVKAEIERRSAQPSFVQWLDNTWILIALLILVLVGGYFWFRVPPLTAEEKFAKGMELYEQGPNYWPQARTDYFLPLLQEDSSNWGEKIEPLLVQMDVHQLKKDFGLMKHSVQKVHNLSEAHRFIHMAREYYQMGDIVQAEQILKNLSQLLTGLPEYETLRLAVEEIVAELELRSQSSAEKASAPQLSSLAWQKAQESLEANEIEQARSILQSLITLYDGDSNAHSDVENAKLKLEALRKSTP